MEKLIKKPEKIFLWICLFWSLLFLIINPPFQAPDEDSHLYKMYSISQGHFYFKKITTYRINKLSGTKEKATFQGQFIPESIINITNINHYLVLHPERKTSLEKTKQMFNVKMDKNNRIFICYPVPTYTILSYFPSIIAIWILSLFKAPPIFMLYTARLCTLLTYISLIYFAIKITPIKKWLFFTLALLPMSVYEAGACSTDGLTIGLIFLFFAYTFNLAYNEKVDKITKKHNLIFFALSIAISVCKFTYLPFIAIYFIIPNEKFNRIKEKWETFSIGLALSISIIAIYIATVYIAGYGTTSFSSNLDKGELLKFALFHPLEYLKLTITTFFKNFNLYFNGFIGMFGWSDTYIPLWSTLLYLIIIISNGLTDTDENNIRIQFKDKILFSFIVFISYILIASVCYLIFTPENNGTIGGIQGRYFIPLAPLFFILFTNTKLKLKTNFLNYFSILTINIVLFISLISIVYRFYIHLI